LFTQLQSALNYVWNVPEPETSGLGLWSMVKSRLIAFLLVFGMTVLLLVSLVIGSSSKFIQDWVENQLGTSLAIVQLMNFIMSVVLATLLFAMIYKILPNAYVNWRSVWIGAFTTSVLFNFGKFLIGLYLGHAAVGSSFGAAGSLVAFLVWVYYSAQLLLLGAEFTQVHAQQTSNGFRYR
jgi:membrane protein